MDITILEKDLDRRFRVIDIYPALLLNPDYSDILDPDSVFYWDSDQLNSGQRVFTIYVQSVPMLYEISAWLLKHGYKHIKLPKHIRNRCQDITWSVKDLMSKSSAFVCINRPVTELRLVVNKKDFKKFAIDINSMLGDLGAFNVYTVLKVGRAGGIRDNETVLKNKIL